MAGPQGPPPPGPPQGSPYETPYAHQPHYGRPLPPKNWLVESILATVLCCVPLGIVGIVYASKVENLAMNGDMVGANEAANKAKLFTILSVVVTLVLTPFYIWWLWDDITSDIGQPDYYETPAPEENIPPSLREMSLPRR